MDGAHWRSPDIDRPLYLRNKAKTAAEGGTNLRNETKCALVIDESLPLGLIANTAAILGAALGKNSPSLLGGNVTDGSGIEHLGSSKSPFPY